MYVDNKSTAIKPRLRTTQVERGPFFLNQIQFSRYQSCVDADSIWYYRTTSRVSDDIWYRRFPADVAFCFFSCPGPWRINVEGGGYTTRVNAMGLVPPHAAHDAVQNSGMARSAPVYCSRHAIAFAVRPGSEIRHRFRWRKSRRGLHWHWMCHSMASCNLGCVSVIAIEVIIAKL